MGILLRVNDFEFTNPVGIIEYPIISSLKNLYFMGGTSLDTTTDRSGNSNNGTIAGEITIGENSALFSGTGTINKMTAQSMETNLDGVTVISLFKKSGLRAVFSQGTSGTQGTIQVAAGRLVYISDTDSASRDIRFTVDDSNNYYIMAWRFSATKYDVYVDEKDKGIKSIASGTGTGSKVKIYSGTYTSLMKATFGGSTYGYGMNGDLTLASCAFYDDILTDNQIRDAVTYLRSYGESKGLTIN